MIFWFHLPTKTAPDTDGGRMEVSIAGGPAIVVTCEEDDTELRSDQFVGAPGESVVASFSWFDRAVPPNYSEARTLEFVLLDNTAPPMPGEFGVMIES